MSCEISRRYVPESESRAQGVSLGVPGKVSAAVEMFWLPGTRHEIPRRVVWTPRTCFLRGVGQVFFVRPARTRVALLLIEQGQDKDGLRR